MRVALTGGVAEGKSTVLRILQEMGRSTYSADVAARQVFSDELVNRRLSYIAGVSGGLEPKDLRDRMFADPSLRRKVNAVTHPLVMKLVLASEAEFVEVPLLYEVCAQNCFDQVWVVTCGSEIQLERLVARVGSVELAKSIIRTQLPTEVKLSFACRVIRTNCDPETVRRGISEALRADSR